MIYCLDDALDTITSELQRHGDGDVMLDVWEDRSEALWYASIRQNNPNSAGDNLRTITTDRGYLCISGPTMRSAILALARML